MTRAPDLKQFFAWTDSLSVSIERVATSSLTQNGRATYTDMNPPSVALMVQMPHLSGIGLIHAGHLIQKGRFSGARRTHDGNHLALFNSKSDVS